LIVANAKKLLGEVEKNDKEKAEYSRQLASSFCTKAHRAAHAGAHGSLGEPSGVAGRGMESVSPPVRT